jgi:hypothetical protein
MENEMNKKKTWGILRTALFIIVGLFNTVLIRPDDVGTWKNYLGYALLLIGIIDAFFIVKKSIRKNKT